MTEPYYIDPTVTIHAGDCLDVLATLPDASVDAVVTDPPYNLGFMGKAWDTIKTINRADPEAHRATRSDGIPRTGASPFTDNSVAGLGAAGPPFQQWCQLWATECLRVLKPGGHLLAFGGTRTSHRLACAIEDAGFEIRDSIAWLYGSGFPKSLDVSKAIDKAAGAERAVVGVTRKGLVPGASSLVGNYTARESADVTAPATPDAERWQGWGTSLKPAHEPVCVARKPLVGTVAANVLAHGTGALNVDGCRVRTDDNLGRPSGNTGFLANGCSSIEELEALAAAGAKTPNGRNAASDLARYRAREGAAPPETHAAGRWPANVILDESQAAALDEQSGTLTSGANPTRRGSDKFRDAYGDFAGQEECTPARGVDTGGASRFFYTAKADASERPYWFRPTCECEDAWPTTSPVRATDATAGPGSSSTSKPGNGTTGDLSPMGTRSTTSTATSSTTTPTTSSLSPLPITSASTQGANSATANGGSPAAPATSSSLLAVPTGISAAKDGRSTGGAAPATSRAWSATSVCGECGAASRRESHATVKPLALMRWLVRLVTPPISPTCSECTGSIAICDAATIKCCPDCTHGRPGVVLEPFAGSGTTVEACILEGFRCIAIEREADYLPLIRQRIHRRRDPVEAVRATGEDAGLFDLLDVEVRERPTPARPGSGAFLLDGCSTVEELRDLASRGAKTPTGRDAAATLRRWERARD